MKISAIMAAAGALCAAAPVTAEPVVLSAGDPRAFVGQLKELGYKPSSIDTAGTTPYVTMDVDEQPTTIIFGGCTLGLNCSYLVLSSSFTDIVNPPAQWLEKINADFDLLKVVRRDDGTLGFNHGITFGKSGLTTDSFRAALEDWKASTAALGQQAVDDKVIADDAGK